MHTNWKILQTVCNAFSHISTQQISISQKSISTYNGLSTLILEIRGFIWFFTYTYNF